MARARRQVSDELRKAIADSGLSLMALAELSGVDEGRLSRFLREERTLTLPAVDSLCQVLRLQLTRKSRRKKVKK